MPIWGKTHLGQGRYNPEPVPYALFMTATATKVLFKVGKRDPALKEKIEKALARLEIDPSHPGLRSHPFITLRGLNDEPIWESTVTQGGAAWRIWWHYGSSEEGKPSITVIAIGKHP